MRKIVPAVVIIMLVYCTTALHAAEDGRTDHAAMMRPWMVMGRGLLNAVGLPLETVSTLRRETEIHKKAWPFTYPFRLMTNIFNRSASAVNDTFFFPWAAPFTDDLSPWTRAMELPDYPWQME